MQRITLLRLIIFIVSGCKVDHSKTKIGNWYSPNFGVIEINQNRLIYYTNALPKEIWKYDSSQDAYRYDGIRYYNCSDMGKKSLYAKLIPEHKDQVILKGVDSCFLKHAFGDEIHLYRVPETIKSHYDQISFSTKIDGKWKEKIYTKEELKQIHLSHDILSIDQQIWLIFRSGISFYSDGSSDARFRIRLRKDNRYLGSRYIAAHHIPEYLTDLFARVNQDLPMISDQE